MFCSSEISLQDHDISVTYAYMHFIMLSRETMTKLLFRRWRGTSKRGSDHLCTQQLRWTQPSAREYEVREYVKGSAYKLTTEQRA